MTRQTISGLTGLTPEQFGNKVANAVTGSEARTIAQEEIENSATVQSAVNSAVSGIDFVAASQAQQRGSLRFYERNMQITGGRNSSLQQPKAGVPNLLIAGDTFLIRFTLNRYSTLGSYVETLIDAGSGSPNHTLNIGFYSSANTAYPAARKCLRIRGSSTPGSVDIVTTPLPDSPEKDFLLAIDVDEVFTVTIRVVSCVTGDVVATGSATLTSGGGFLYRNSGFCISNGCSSDQVFKTDVNTLTNVGLCGGVADIAIIRERFSDAQLAVMAKSGILAGDITDPDNSVLYAREFWRSDYKSAFMPADLSGPINVLGEQYLEAGSTIGHAGTFTVIRKPVGYIAGIGSRQNGTTLNLTAVTDNAVEGIIEYRLRSAGAYITDWRRVATCVAGTSQYTLALSMPVTTAWCQIEFRLGDDIYYYNDPVAAGIKAHLIGQSQMAYFQSIEPLAGVVPDPKYPAAYAREENESGYPFVRYYRLDNQVQPDGCAGFVHHCNQNVAMPVAVICNDVPGTGVHEWCDDSDTDRQWSWTQYIADVAGRDMSCHVWQWGTSNMLNNYGPQILTPVVEGIPTDNGGVASGGVPVLQHYLYDGVTFDRDAIFILSPLTGHRDNSTVTEGSATDEAYSGTVGSCRQSQLDWAAARGITIGPFTNDLPTGGPHQYTQTPKSNWRMGIRMAEAVLRGLGFSDRRNPYIKEVKWAADGVRNQIDVVIQMVNRGALRTDGGDPTWNFEYDDGAGLTRLGFSAEIINPITIRLTKDSGDWSDNVMIYFQHNGPFGYGIYGPGEMDALELEMTSGQIYDGVGMDGTEPGDSLGTPIASRTTGYAIG